ncbi:MAG: DEAD/DEAH box helicase [Verrucomicrobiae bacterium]|nr:DEAD/DEAH box helicase [Verrucomicrobiae bacterium]
MRLRDYQVATVDAIFKEWEENQSTLAVLPTGCGKTQIFCEVIRRVQPRRALVIAHREELIFQAAKRIESIGVGAEIEMADQRASVNLWTRAPAVVSTVQTQCAGGNGGRMTLFKPEDFGVLIIDEGHHATASSYRRVMAYYGQNPELKILGVTATPDRADEEALGQVFQSVAFDYEILDAIKDGWLVPIEQKMIEIEGLDFSAIRTTAGDLNGGDLAAVMEAEQNLHGVASATLDIVGQKKTLVFTASVKQAEMLSEIFNRHKPGASDWICGETPKDARRERLEQFSTGQTQFMVNCGVLTEGFDAVGIEVVVMARPTKSRALYSQMVGRATRPLPGVVDGPPTPEMRRMAMAASAKPSCLVVDFSGNTGRHKLMTTADILGGKFEDEVIERAKKVAEKAGKPVNMAEVLEEEKEKARLEAEERRRAEAARRAHLIGKAKFSARTVNPFDAFDLDPERARGWNNNKTLSDKQTALLLRQGIDPSGMPYGQAKQVLNELFRRWNSNLATLKQCSLLKKYGYETKNLTMQEASALIDGLAQNGWRRAA